MKFFKDLAYLDLLATTCFLVLQTKSNTLQFCKPKLF
jgi:hypothetical protein